MRGELGDDPIEHRIRRGFNAVRSADLFVVLDPFEERQTPKLKDTATRISQSFLAEQRDPPHQHHRPAQVR